MSNIAGSGIIILDLIVFSKLLNVSDKRLLHVVVWVGICKSIDEVRDNQSADD